MNINPSHNGIRSLEAIENVESLLGNVKNWFYEGRVFKNLTSTISFPEDVVHLIFIECDVKTLGRVMSVSKFFFHCANKDSWKAKFWKANCLKINRDLMKEYPQLQEEDKKFDWKEIYKDQADVIDVAQWKGEKKFSIVLTVCRGLNEALKNYYLKKKISVDLSSNKLDIDVLKKIIRKECSKELTHEINLFKTKRHFSNLKSNLLTLTYNTFHTATEIKQLEHIKEIRVWFYIDENKTELEPKIIPIHFVKNIKKDWMIEETKNGKQVKETVEKHQDLLNKKELKENEHLFLEDEIEGEEYPCRSKCILI